MAVVGIPADAELEQAEKVDGGAPVDGAGGVLRETLRETLDIEGRVRRHPYGMLAGALGIGFVLGGGLSTRLAVRVLGAGLRIGLAATLPILKEKLIESVTETKYTNEGEER
jgi:hypothetical protein